MSRARRTASSRALCTTTETPSQARCVSLPRLDCAQPDVRFLPQVTVRMRDGKKIVHDGIKVEFVGNIGEPGSRRLGRASWALTDDGQSCSMIGAITRSFFRFRRSSRRRASCAKPRRSTFCSRTSRSSMRATRESMSSCGASCISPQLRVYR